MIATGTETVLDALAASLRAAAGYNHNAEVAPVAVLWADASGQWEPIVPRLNLSLPVLSLGPYKPRDRTGPAGWLRCAVAGVLDDVIPAGATPVVYVPRWSASGLRRAGDYPRSLQPLAGLRFRCSLWLQPDGQEWTIAAFLAREDGGLGVAVHDGEAARAAMCESLIDLVEQPIAELRANAPLKAADFRRLTQGPAQTPESDLKALIARGEGPNLEFKETARFNARDDKADPNLEREVWKSVCGFLNSDEGGTLLIGVADDGTPLGLERDFSVTKTSRRGQDVQDAFLLSIVDLLTNRLGGRVVSCTRVSLDEVDGKTICQVGVRPAPWPIWADEGSKGRVDEVFYVRYGNATKKLTPSQQADYIETHWPRR